MFERRALRNICGAVQDKRQWRRRWEFDDEPDLAKYINRSKWAGHVILSRVCV
jgi:hypothetical protein